MQLGTTFTRFVIEQQRKYPHATGEFTDLISELRVAGKIIEREVRKAGVREILGSTDRLNVHGEDVQKLDEFANETIIDTMDHLGHLAGIASEEMEGVYQIPDTYPCGNYILLLDPVDGSSNIDVNVSIGTIFSVYRTLNDGSATEADFLRRGSEQVCAGYILYGSSTMLVYSSGHGVHGFTLDPTIGEFLLSHEHIRIPSRGKIYSANESNYHRWKPGMRRYIDQLKDGNGSTQPYSARYIGSLVSDFHRNLLKGGIFLYPDDERSPRGKLRLLYEAAPLAFIIDQAGGKASDGERPILEIEATELHERTPLYIGSPKDVEEAVAFIQQEQIEEVIST